MRHRLRHGGQWLAVLGIAAMLASGGSQAADYVVDGFALGQPIDAGDPNYASYTCQPSADYDGAIICSKEQQRKGQAGQLRVRSTLVHADGGPTWLATVHAAPVKLSRAALEKEIDDLTAVIGEAPATVAWDPGYMPDRTAVVATWGEVGLEPIYLPEPDDIDRPGAYLDLFAEPAASLDEFLPVFQVKGGAGYIYAANFDAAGIGDRYYVAVNSRELAPAHYRTQLRALLHEDATLAADDYSLWPDVALATRTLTLATSSADANAQFDDVARAFPASKLRSHVWASLPSGAIDRLRQGSFWINYDIYGPETRYPAIRQELQGLIANEPDDGFVDFAHLLLGDFEGGLRARPDSPIAGVFHYALGIESFRGLLKDALMALRADPPENLSDWDRDHLVYLTTEQPDDPEWSFPLDSALYFATREPGVAVGRLSAILPDFSDRAEQVRSHFSQITDAMSVADDAAFMTAWLAFEQGNLEGALGSVAKGLAIGNAHPDIDGTRNNSDWLDYQRALRGLARRTVDRLPHEVVVRTLAADKVLSKEGYLWYGAAREAYRAFDYDYAIELAEGALDSLGLPSDQLPATTDPGKIRGAIEQIAPQLLSDLNIVELPYLLEASREIASYEHDLGAQANAADAGEFSARARKLISKYSMLVSRPDDTGRQGDVPPRHQDLRQALHLIDTTRAQTAGNPSFAPLQEWLAFRKVKVLTVYDPDQVRGAVAQLAEAFPQSQYLDDALAEQVFVEGMLKRDTEAARQALDDLIQRAPAGSNAVDNGYSWLQISLRCQGQDSEADAINSEIVRLFPFSRHAAYAVERLTHPDRPARGCSDGFLD